MITGKVTEKLEAVLTFSIYDSQGNLRELEALIDTGYTAYLTLPAAIIAEFELESLATGQLKMADGSEVASEIYHANVIWDGQPRRIAELAELIQSRRKSVQCGSPHAVRARLCRPYCVRASAFCTLNKPYAGLKWTPLNQKSWWECLC